MDLLSVLRLPRTMQNARRVQEILAVLVRHGGADLLLRLGLGRRRPWRRDAEALEVPGSERRVRLAFQELGPTFIKLGQLLACRSDLVGISLARELRVLQDRAPAFPAPEARDQVERALGRPLSELFAEFEEQPLAAASVSQVHRARLHSGDAVVVKVRRPGLSEIIARDLDILSALAQRIDQRQLALLPVSASELLEEFRHSVLQEVDLRREASHLSRLQRIHADDPEVRCVRVYPELCSERVLTLEYVEGVRPDDLEGLDRLGVDRKELACRLLRLTARQVLEHGFFHADPHAGNLLVRNGGLVTPIDLGMVGRLSRRERDDLLELLAAVFQDDAHRVGELLDRMEILPQDCNRTLFERDLQELIDAFTDDAIARVPLAGVMGGLLDALTRHRATAPVGFFMLAKTLAAVEGVVHELAPEMNPADELRPLVTRLYLERAADPVFLARDWTRAGERAERLLRTGPARLDGLLHRLEEGRLRLQVAAAADPEALARQERGARQLAMAVLAGAGFVGSTRLLALQPGPELAGLPMFELLGYAGLCASASAACLVGFSAIAPRRR